MSGNDAVDDAFEAGFNEDANQLTATPEKPVVEAPKTNEEGNQAANQDAEPLDPPGKLKPAPVEYAQITKQEYEDLRAKASRIDEIQAAHSKTVDSFNGKFGSMKQMIDRLQSSTQSGQPVAATIEDFKELVDEGYPDLAEMQMAGINRVLAKLNVRGTSGNDQPAQSFDEAKARELFGAQFETGANELREKLRYELAHEALTNEHEDWEQVIRSKEFGKWRDDNAINDKKDRKGITFAESTDPRFVAKIIADFKASQKQTAARQNRLADAVTPKGAGGHGTGQKDDDEFLSAFNS